MVCFMVSGDFEYIDHLFEIALFKKACEFFGSLNQNLFKDLSSISLYITEK